MEQGFTLPKSALRRLAIQWGCGVLLGIGIVYFRKSSVSLSEAVGLFAIPIALFVVAGWYLSTYKYVYLSGSGIRGRPTSGLKWRQLAWSEPLVSKQTSLSGLKGQLFTSSASKEAVFIPTAILKSVEFKATVAQYAPVHHVLREKEG
jgi:hypothetical protein